MNLREWLDSKLNKAARINIEMLDQLAAAYLLKTNLPPDEVMLCQEVTPTGMRWWFERKIPVVKKVEELVQEGGKFYKMGEEFWCDTAMDSWKLVVGVGFVKQN